VIEVLAFDVFGTLYDVGSLVSAAEGIVPNPEAFVRTWRAKQLEYTHLLSMMERYERFWNVTERALRYTLRLFGISLSDQGVEELMGAWLRLRPYGDVPEALARLAERFKLVTLTNGDREMVDALLSNTGLRGFFADLLTADEVGIYKPSPKVYALVERLGVSRSEVGFVSSNPWDVAGAGAAGLTPIFVNRHGLPQEELGIVARVEVRDLRELAERL
jgi:2-haloalkanoic acid dehalogenase, type II